MLKSFVLISPVLSGCVFTVDKMSPSSKNDLRVGHAGNSLVAELTPSLSGSQPSSTLLTQISLPQRHRPLNIRINFLYIFFQVAVGGKPVR